MTDYPILFSTPMVQALLEGTKTQTRRLASQKAWQKVRGGDRLWVREKHWVCEVRGNGIGNPFLIYEEEFDNGGHPKPKVLRPLQEYKKFGTHPSIHMPRWASRLTLVVTDVRMQKLQDISEEDAEAEGTPPIGSGSEMDELWCPKCRGLGVHGALGQNLGYTEVDCRQCETPRQLFKNLWNHIHTPRKWDAPLAWESNPAVIAITFDVHKRNIDEEELCAR